MKTLLAKRRAPHKVDEFTERMEHQDSTIDHASAEKREMCAFQPTRQQCQFSPVLPGGVERPSNLTNDTELVGGRGT